MAIGDPYITRQQLASYLGIPLTQTDVSRDAKLDAAIAGASTAIEDHCRRQFNTDGTATARVYEPAGSRLVIVDDFYDTSTLLIQRRELSSTTWSDPWTSNNFELEPRNGIVNGRPRPYRRIVLPYWTFLWGVSRIQVTAKWGWQTVPKSIIQAAYIMAAQFYKLPDAPLGVAGFGSGSDGFSAVRVTDIPQAYRLLCDYVINPIQVS